MSGRSFPKTFISFHRLIRSLTGAICLSIGTGYTLTPSREAISKVHHRANLPLLRCSPRTPVIREVNYDKNYLMTPEQLKSEQFSSVYEFIK